LYVLKARSLVILIQTELKYNLFGHITQCGHFNAQPWRHVGAHDYRKTLLH